MIDLNEKYFCEEKNVEIVNTWINREKLKKLIEPSEKMLS